VRVTCIMYKLFLRRLCGCSVILDVDEGVKQQLRKCMDITVDDDWEFVYVTLLHSRVAHLEVEELDVSHVKISYIMSALATYI
jgi:hypothetical protein